MDLTSFFSYNCPSPSLLAALRAERQRRLWIEEEYTQQIKLIINGMVQEVNVIEQKHAGFVLYHDVVHEEEIRLMKIRLDELSQQLSQKYFQEKWDEERGSTKNLDENKSILSNDRSNQLVSLHSCSESFHFLSNEKVENERAKIASKGGDIDSKNITICSISTVSEDFEVVSM